MSFPFSVERVADLQRDARLQVERTTTHKDDLEAFAASAERDLSQAERAAAQATFVGVDEARELLYSHARRSAAAAAAARRLSGNAREQHAAACRMLTEMDSDPSAGSRTNAVLVVDDYGDVREMVARVLQDAGFVVRTAANGLEGLIAAYEMRPGVIVMDVTMPVLGGIEATRLIKASDATRDARVIAYTGTPLLDDAVVRQLFAAVLEKPAPPHVVVATVQQVASQ
jgi:CheY-like chemotaxis protein